MTPEKKNHGVDWEHVRRRSIGDCRSSSAASMGESPTMPVHSAKAVDAGFPAGVESSPPKADATESREQSILSASAEVRGESPVEGARDEPVADESSAPLAEKDAKSSKSRSSKSRSRSKLASRSKRSESRSRRSSRSRSATRTKIMSTKQKMLEKAEQFAAETKRSSSLSSHLSSETRTSSEDRIRSTTQKKQTADKDSIRIAVIGGGPSGLFFTHAINKILSSDNFERRQIEITIFEKSSGPGGQWQSSADGVDNDVACYDNLWTNGASHGNEYPDYTFDEHFGRPVDVYMRRKDLLEYILGRVTKGNANFFDDHVVTNTEVIMARYIKERCKFEVRTRNVKTGVENNIQYFDKCVWAAGDNGLRYFPQKLVDQVLQGGFSGRIIHSTDMREFDKDVKGKRIVLIGGGFSAEDLALQAVKVGVNHVTIVVRDEKGGEVANTRYWPYDKVNVLRGMTVTGSEGERRIRLSKSGDLPDVDESKGCLYLDDIETIILCTGYSVNQNMLSTELQRDFGDMEEELLLPNDWKMDHPLDKITGDTEPDAGYYSPRTSPDYYNGVSMTNPNMMFMTYNNFWWPLLAIDVYANILAGVCCGTVKLPTLEDARRQNYEESLRQMRDPLTRYYMDDEYYYPFQKFDELTMDLIYHANHLFNMKAFDEKMKLANYPLRFFEEGGLQFTFDDIRQCHPFEEGKLPPGLTDAGRIFYLLCVNEKLHRRGEEEEDIQNKEKHTLTYRDYTNGQDFYSMYTGTRARPSLESPWLSL